jgi:hypothetical protein
MAKVVLGSLASGILGTVAGLTFNKNGTVSQQTSSKGSNAPRVKEQNAEFGSAARASRILRNALASTFMSGFNSFSASKVSQKMSQAIKLDLTSVRGQRNVLDGELSVLEGYDINDMSSLSSVFGDVIDSTIVRSSGLCTVMIPAFVPSEIVSAPTGTTHFQFVAEAASIDFGQEMVDSAKTVGVFHPYNGILIDSETLSVNLMDASTDPIFLAVAVNFYQEINGAKYALDNKQFNTAKILKVDTGV